MAKHKDGCWYTEGDPPCPLEGRLQVLEAKFSGFWSGQLAVNKELEARLEALEQVVTELDSHDLADRLEALEQQGCKKVVPPQQAAPPAQQHTCPPQCYAAHHKQQPPYERCAVWLAGNCPFDSRPCDGCSWFQPREGAGQ